MPRPPFLDQPHCWTRTPRTDQSRVDQAYAGTKHVNSKMHPADRVVTVASAAALVALAVLMLTGAV